MYGREEGGEPGGERPPPWLVRAEVTIRHGATPSVTTESGQLPVNVSSTVTDSGGVRMIYRWNTSESPRTTASPVPTTSAGPSPSSSGFAFQRGNIVFTSTPPARCSPGSFTMPRSGSTGNDRREESALARGTNVSDSGYYSERFSPQSYSSLPSRRPSTQYSRRCKSTCSIVLASYGSSADGARQQEGCGKLSEASSKQDNSWRHHSAHHQHAFPRRQFTTVPEVCEDCTEGHCPGGNGDGGATHPARVEDKIATISKDASSQTTDIEAACRESAWSDASTKSKGRRKATNSSGGLRSSDEQKKQKKQERRSPSSVSETTVASLPPSERSDSSAREDSAKRRSRTVHIDVYCTGTEDDENSATSSGNECDTPITVFENPDVRVTHTEVGDDVLPRGFQDDGAFLRRATERRCDSFKHAPMRMPSIASSKGYDSDDMLSSLYPSQFSSYSALRDLDSAPWSAASSYAGIPFDYDSTVATSPKDTLSDIESLINSKPADLTPCDSFEYASSSDRERIRRMEEEMWPRSGSEGKQRWRTSPVIGSRHLLQNRKMREYLEKHEVGWSSAESCEDSDESGTVGWSFVSSEESHRVVKRSSLVRGESKTGTATGAAGTRSSSFTEDDPLRQKRTSLQDRSDSTTRSDSIPNPCPFGSESPSPHPSKVPSRVTSPFMTSQGERTDHILKASIFGTVVNAFRKPGHHIGPSKNPSCSCEHCRRHFEELNSRDRAGAQFGSEFARRTGFRLNKSNEKRTIGRPFDPDK